MEAPWREKGRGGKTSPRFFGAICHHKTLNFECVHATLKRVRSRIPESSFSIRSAACLQVRKSGNEVFLFLYSFFCLLISLTCCFSSVSFSSPFPPFFFWGFLSLDGEREREEDQMKNYSSLGNSPNIRFERLDLRLSSRHVVCLLWQNRARYFLSRRIHLLPHYTPAAAAVSLRLVVL